MTQKQLQKEYTKIRHIGLALRLLKKDTVIYANQRL